MTFDKEKLLQNPDSYQTMAQALSLGDGRAARRLAAIIEAVLIPLSNQKTIFVILSAAKNLFFKRS